jgi:hypothetical protein
MRLFALYIISPLRGSTRLDAISVHSTTLASQHLCFLRGLSFRRGGGVGGLTRWSFGLWFCWAFLLVCIALVSDIIPTFTFVYDHQNPRPFLWAGQGLGTVAEALIWVGDWVWVW